MRKLIHTRLNKNEKETVEKLAKQTGMTVSDYIKYRLFDQNPDLIEEKFKYLCPRSSNQGYYLAISVMKIQRLLREILLGRKDISADEYLELDAVVTSKSRELIASVGYKRIEKEEDE